jgi:hypothetical protein
MGRKGTARVTGKQIMVMATSTGERGSAEGGMAALIKSLIKKILHGDSDTRENAAGMLASLAIQNHFEHTGTLFANGAVGPLVRLLITGSSKAQGHAASALHAIAHNKLEHQQAIVEAGSVGETSENWSIQGSGGGTSPPLLSSTVRAVFHAHANQPA